MKLSPPGETARPYLVWALGVAGGIGATRGQWLWLLAALAGALPTRAFGVVLLGVALGFGGGQLAIGREQGQLLGSGPTSFEGETLTALTDLRPSPFGGGWLIARAGANNLMVRFEDEPDVAWAETFQAWGPIDPGSGAAAGHAFIGTLQVREMTDPSPPANPGQRWANTIRARVLERLDERRPAEALLAGFLIGDTSGLPEPDYEAMRRAGISHFVAVSGSNVAGFLVLWWVVLGPIGIGPRRRGILGLVGLAIFLMVTRWEPSVVRAGAMAAAVLLARALGFALETWTAFGLGLGSTLLVAPNLLTEFGFQLSVAATAGILLGHRLFTTWDSRLAQPLAVTISAQVAVAPLLLIRSGEVPLIAPLSNLLAAPLVALATLLSAVGITLAISPLLGAARLIARLVLQLAQAFAWFPQVKVGHLLLGAGLVLLGCRVATWRWLAVLGTLTLVVAVLLQGPRPQPGIVFVDVGQGDAALLFDQAGRAVLIDGGPEPGELWEALYRYRVRSLDLVVATHPHLDHIGGFVGLAGRLRIGEVWHAQIYEPSPVWDRLTEEFAATGVPVRVPAIGSRHLLGDLGLEVIGPTRRFDEVNDQSLVVLVRRGAYSVLFSGDIEATAQAELGRIDVDLLKVPHHGGATSIDSWLIATSPEVAVISVGVNSFGHPAPTVISALERAGSEIRRTDLEGDVVMPLGTVGGP